MTKTIDLIARFIVAGYLLSLPPIFNVILDNSNNIVLLGLILTILNILSFLAADTIIKLTQKITRRL